MQVNNQRKKAIFLCILLFKERQTLKDLTVNKQCTSWLTCHLAWRVLLTSPGAFRRYIMSIYSGKVLRKEARGSGHARPCSGWRSSLPVGSSSSLPFSAAARSSPELSAAGHSPHTGR